MTKREKTVNVLLSDDEFAFVDTVSHGRDISRSAFVRSLIFREQKRISDKVAKVKRNIARAGK